jgi:hypothetical protein
MPKMWRSMSAAYVIAALTGASWSASTASMNSTRRITCGPVGGRVCIAPVAVTWPWPAPAATAIDAFGGAPDTEVNDGQTPGPGVRHPDIRPGGMSARSAPM